MGIFFKSDMSRLKKKLLLYFLLISIVSISVSAEIILEFSSPRFKETIEKNYYSELAKTLPQKDIDKIKSNINKKKVFNPIYDLRDRMILLLLVVSFSIIGAFFLFTKDIVDPMDGMVAATKQIVDGDLTVKVPVMTEDEIGQIGSLINNMNEKLLDMIVQVKQDLNRHKDKIMAASHLITEIINNNKAEDIIEHKKMRVGDFKNMIKLGEDVIALLEIMTTDLTSLQTFINMYKTYSLKTELSQDEIENAIKNYNSDDWV